MMTTTMTTRVAGVGRVLHPQPRPAAALRAALRRTASARQQAPLPPRQGRQSSRVSPANCYATRLQWRPRPSCTLPYGAFMPACKPRLALLHLPRLCASRHPPAGVKRPTPTAASKGAMPFSDWVSHVVPNDAWLMMSFVVAWFCGEWGCFVKMAWGGVHQVAAYGPCRGAALAVKSA